ncbi:MAG: hypothetical protein ACRD2C_24170 [Acidimicrobiales bacterium]
MAIDRPTEQRPRARGRLVAAVVALAYVAFAVFAQLIGEDQPDEAELVRLDAFCAALYSDYGGLISSLAYEGDAFGPLGGSEGGQPFFTGFIDADLAPAEYRDDVAFLTEGIDRAVAGDLPPEEVETYLDAYEDLRDRATPTCDRVGREIQIEDLPSNELG